MINAVLTLFGLSIPERDPNAAPIVTVYPQGSIDWAVELIKSDSHIPEKFFELL
jgi:hypothetical protein